MTYKDGGGILLVTDGPLTQEEWARLLQYVTDVLGKDLKPKSDCTCLFLLNGIHANGCPKCTGKPGVIPVDAEKRNDESNLCGVFVGGMGPCIAPIPCQVHPEKRPGLARICTCTGQGHTDECELAHKRIDDKLPCGCPSKDGPNCHLTMCCERTKGLDH